MATAYKLIGLTFFLLFFLCRKDFPNPITRAVFLTWIQNTQWYFLTKTISRAWQLCKYWILPFEHHFTTTLPHSWSPLCLLALTPWKLKRYVIKVLLCPCAADFFFFYPGYMTTITKFGTWEHFLFPIFPPKNAGVNVKVVVRMWQISKKQNKITVPPGAHASLKRSYESGAFDL